MTHKYICSNFNTINLKLFRNHGGIYRFGKIFNKDSTESLKLIVKDESGKRQYDSMFVYHFVNPDLKEEIIFTKEKGTENGGIDFEIMDIDTSAH